MTDSMRDTLEATFKAMEERDAEQDDDKETGKETPDVEDEPKDKDDADTAEDDIPEGEEASTETPEAKKAEPDSKKAPEDSKQQKPGAEKVPTSPPDKSLANPPITWRAKAKAQWNAIPEDVKREIRRREQDALNGITQYKQAAAYGEKLSQTIQPYQAFLTARNTTPERVVKDALDLAYRLTTGTPQERGAVLQLIAQQYGADLTPTKPNPEQDRLQQVLSPVLNELNELKRSLHNSQQAAQQRQTQTLEQQVEEFAAKTDETGAYVHPYFEEVKGLMAALLESGQAKQLDDAYALATRAHPEISQLVLAEDANRAKRKQDEALRKEKARRNSSVNFQRTPTSDAVKPPQRSIRETIEETWNRLQAN